MSVVVAIKYNNGVILGSDTQVTSFGHLKVDGTRKIYKSKYSNTAYGVTGALRDLDLISCNIDDLMNSDDILEKVPFDKKYVVNHVVTDIYNLLIKYNRAMKIDNVLSVDNEILVASDDNIFTISCDGSVLEYENYAAIGSGFELVFGHLDSINTNDLSRPEAIDLVKRCIKLSCKNEIHINNEAYIIELNKEDK